MNNKVLLYSIGNYIQCLIITDNGKEYVCVCVCVCVSEYIYIGLAKKFVWVSLKHYIYIKLPQLYIYNWITLLYIRNNTTL